MLSLQRFKHLFREGFWIVVGQAMVMIASLIGVRVLTGLLSPAEYGEFALGLTIATLVNQTILGPLGQGVMRFYAPAIEGNDITGYLHAVRKLVWMSNLVIVFLMSFGVVILIITRQDKWISITISSLLFASVSGYNAILNGIQNAARQRLVVALHQGIEYWLRFLVAAALINWFGPSSTVTMIGCTLGITIVLFSQFIYFFKVFPSPSTWINRDNIWQEKIWQYSWPMSVFGIFTWLQVVSDRWTLGIFRTKDEVGMYAALFQLGYYPISMATGMAVQLLAPIFFQRSGDGNDADRNADVSRLGWRLTILALGLTTIVFCASFLLHVQIFDIFVDRKYRNVSYLFPWIVLSGGIFSASQTIALNLLSQSKTYIMMPIKITTALLGIILNLIGGYSYGTVGIVMASVLFSIACFFSMATLLYNTQPINND